jgi:hypothetical protein
VWSASGHDLVHWLLTTCKGARQGGGGAEGEGLSGDLGTAVFTQGLIAEYVQGDQQ